MGSNNDLVFERTSFTCSVCAIKRLLTSFLRHGSSLELLTNHSKDIRQDFLFAVVPCSRTVIGSSVLYEMAFLRTVDRKWEGQYWLFLHNLKQWRWMQAGFLHRYTDTDFSISLPLASLTRWINDKTCFFLSTNLLYNEWANFWRHSDQCSHF